MDFDTLLARFSQVAQTQDSEGLAALFTPDGTYDDAFFGPHTGRADIAAMHERFHVGGEAFCWEFTDPACTGDTGYASYVFSYRSREPESAGQLIMFDGMARFRLRDGLIADYAELFDRGVAFVQLGYPTARVRKLIDRYATALRESPACAAHLAAREARAQAS